MIELYKIYLLNLLFFILSLTNFDSVEMFGKINFTPTTKNANQKNDTTSFLQNPNKIYPPKNKPIAKHDKNHKNTKISTMSKHTKNNKSVKFEKQ